MKLFYHVMIRLSLGVIVVLTAWAALFYAAMVDEINDEVDDTLEDYSDLIITRSLAGKELPNKEQLILVYCRSGRRSKIAATELVKLGYTNVKEFGGIIDWPYEVVK